MAGRPESGSASTVTVPHVPTPAPVTWRAHRALSIGSPLASAPPNKSILPLRSSHTAVWPWRAAGGVPTESVISCHVQVPETLFNRHVSPCTAPIAFRPPNRTTLSSILGDTTALHARGLGFGS